MNFAADDFAEIRKAQRQIIEAENRCTCPKFEGGGRKETNPYCAAHGDPLGKQKEAL